ncbi:MAG TPA: threonine synthase, partial [Burkholderiaceae bacterium]
FSDILLEGLAPDGGLAVPQALPRIDAALLESWRGLAYADLAFEVLSRFASDIPAEDLRRLTRAAYQPASFKSAEIVPLKPLDGSMALLGLSEGPTLAFKDMAMQFLGQVFEYVLGKRGATLNILGATSGDTGSAAEYALRGKKGVAVFMLSPHGRMSAFQRAQMYSLQDENIYNVAVRGVFDEAQDIVKALAGDLDFKSRMRLGAVNSINWARIAAQVVYYFWGWLRATDGGKPGQQVSFTVPSGNFGNILSGHIARGMGLPVRRLVLATNENNVLEEFFRTGIYSPRGPEHTYATSSPSMDISRASNFERYVFELLERDGAQVERRFSGGGEFDLSLVPRPGFVSGRSTHADRLATIREVHARYGVTIDPHTADGVKVGLAHRERGVPLVCLETAQPAKFAETIREALGREPARPPGFEDIENLPQRFEVVPPDPEAVKAIIARGLPG